MMRILITSIALSLGAFPSLAASSMAETAIKTFQAVGANAGKLKIFCEMTKVMKAMGEKEDAAAQAKIQGFLKQLGTDFETAWNGSNEVDEESADGKAMDAALAQLSGKCT